MAACEIQIADVAGLLKGINGEPIASCLMIGAGASKSAGIGLAADFVETIKNNHAASYQRARRQCANGVEPDYGQCMAALTPAQQTSLVRAAIESAKINWAHIGIALLESCGFINSILTTNFDPLASRACALFNRFPAIYDLAGLRDREGGRSLQFDRSFVSGSAIYHLHGQHTGFLLLNTEEKLRSQADRIAPVLNATMIGRPVIICGYSGKNDPVVERIAEIGQFPHGLVWICHDANPPSPYVMETLLDKVDSCYFVINAPADDFFDKIFRVLEIEPPLFLSKPFDHMLAVLNTVTVHKIKESQAPDLIKAARERLIAARSAERLEKPDLENLHTLAAKGKWTEVWQKYGGNKKADQLDLAAKDLVAWSAIRLGNDLALRAAEAQAAQQRILFRRAIKMYEKAASYNSKMYQAFINWGDALRELADTFDTPVRENLLNEAEQKLRYGLSLKPDDSYGHHNLGALYASRAKDVEGPQANQFYSKAIDELRESLKTQPMSTLTLNALATALLLRTAYVGAKNKMKLIREAKDACEAAEAISPGVSSYNLACVYGKLNNADKASAWLLRCHSHGKLPLCDHVWGDPDFESIRNAPAFLSAMAEVGCPNLQQL